MDVKKLNEIVKGESTSALCMCQEITQNTTRNGKSYCVVKMRDETDTIEAKLWNAEKEKCTLRPGGVYEFILDCQDYNGAPSFVIQGYGSERTDLSAKDFQKHAPVDEERMLKEISSTIKDMPDDLKAVCMGIFKEHPEFRSWAAAKSIHHAFYGGLLYHTYRMLRMAKAVTTVYSGVDRPVLYAAVILHDVGKLQEMSFNEMDGHSEFTVNGQLFGHSLLGIKMIWEMKARLGVDTERIKCVEHCLAAHHGNLDWGAITVPCTLEAQMLHLIDMMDARVEIFEEQLAKIDSGTSGDRCFALNGACVYKPDYEDQ